ncbi:hypothetical protein PACTADRAFT_2851 [Pachysolen tannophilus NRRL Y-2460]|uniref:Uncharacterized protein n=1 Tax=Pachysolen tannophilus NRRL Y-2460 TaxID=669874 RepID=A0A1E4TTS6_PACTA|nr:hypothetical protein PACTADRAFT_2851 [Pachysolen tannophilus NRRL Y-2460]
MSNFFRDTNLFKPRKNNIFSSSSSSALNADKHRNQQDLSSSVLNGDVASSPERRNNSSNKNDDFFMNQDNSVLSTEDSNISTNITSGPKKTSTANTSVKDVSLKDNNNNNNNNKVIHQEGEEEEEEDDDSFNNSFEIMEIRDVNGQTQTNNDVTSPATTTTYSKSELDKNDQNESDLKKMKSVEVTRLVTDDDSLQPLLLTIQSLTNIRHQLESKLKNSQDIISQKNEEIRNNKDRIQAIKQKVEKAVQLIGLLNDEIISVKSEKNEFFNKLTDIQIENQTFHTKLGESKFHVENLSKKLDALRNKFIINNSEVEKKDLIINNLKSKINDFSGRLSEEKLRAIGLEKELDHSRKNYDSNIAREAELRMKFQEKFESQRSNLKLEFNIDQNATDVIKDKLEYLNSNIEKLETNFFEKLSKWDSVPTTITKEQEKSFLELKKEINGAYDKILISNGNLKDGITTDSSKVNEKFEKIFKDFGSFSNKLDQQQNSLESFDEIIEEKLKEKQELNTRLQTATDELVLQKLRNEELMKELTLNQTKSADGKSEIEKLHKKIEEATQENKRYINELKELKDDIKLRESKLAEFEKTSIIERENFIKSYESKLRSQTDLNTQIVNENEKAKESARHELLAMRKSYNEIKISLNSTLHENQTLKDQLCNLKKFSNSKSIPKKELEKTKVCKNSTDQRKIQRNETIQVKEKIINNADNDDYADNVDVNDNNNNNNNNNDDDVFELRSSPKTSPEPQFLRKAAKRKRKLIDDRSQNESINAKNYLKKKAANQ